MTEPTNANINETRVQKIKPPKRLWFASLNLRSSGKWMPNQKFYLHKPYFPNVAEHCLCHVLYDTPMEAFLGLRDELTKINASKTRYTVFLYSVDPKLITPNNYFPPSVCAERQMFTKDSDLITRHLIRQSLNFVRCGNLEVINSYYTPAEVLQLQFLDSMGNWKDFCTIIKPTVSYQCGVWSGIQLKGLTDALFNFETHEFKTEVRLIKREPTNDNIINDMATSRVSTIASDGSPDTSNL